MDMGNLLQKLIEFVNLTAQIACQYLKCFSVKIYWKCIFHFEYIYGHMGNQWPHLRLPVFLTLNAHNFYKYKQIWMNFSVEVWNMNFQQSLSLLVIICSIIRFNMSIDMKKYKNYFDIFIFNVYTVYCKIDICRCQCVILR